MIQGVIIKARYLCKHSLHQCNRTNGGRTQNENNNGSNLPPILKGLARFNKYGSALWCKNESPLHNCLVQSNEATAWGNMLEVLRNEKKMQRPIDF